jgi:type II restriction/modification system DNA methylase subunit YeeA
MDKNAIKKYAVWARNELITRVSQKALLYGITKNNIVDAAADSINDKLLTDTEKKQRQALIAQIKEKGFEQVMEEVAYTWFNRFSALRFMEVNGYLPSHVRVFTNQENNFKPQIITEAIHLEMDGLDMEKVYAFKEADKTEELYKYLLITQCNALNKILPGMFQRISDYTELLLPDNLLREGSVIEQMISLIPEDDWKDAVQIIGWLYQYYNSEPKDTVFANLKKNIKITKENIPAATQLFTPDWIVRYMIENSLGRLWLEGHPNDELKSEWKYYLDEVQQEAGAQAQIEKIREEYKTIKPEEIRVVDPCMGSGHILVYAFDILMQIYEAYGFNQRDAAKSIVENNIFGLDIDERAAQMAYFAVMMKARQYDRRFLSREVQPNVYAICESNHLDQFCVDYFINGDVKLKADMQMLIDELRDAKEYGSILNVTNVDFAAMCVRFDEIRNDINITREAALNELLPFIKVAQVIAQKYDVVVTNPPYMSNGGMSERLASFVQTNYPDSKRDLFAVFIEKCAVMKKPNGFQAMITQHSWMFINSYEGLRTKILRTAGILNMAHLGARAFEEIGGEVVQTVAFVFGSKLHEVGTYIRLVDFNSQEEKEKQYLSAAQGTNTAILYRSIQNDFFKIPRSPIAYWLGHATISEFENNRSIGEEFFSCYGLLTGHDEGFIFNWYEVSYNKISFESDSVDAFNASGKKYAPLCKGGLFRKWYGNRDLVVKYDSEGIRGMSKYPKYASNGVDRYFSEGITWAEVCLGNLSVRYMPEGNIFSLKGPSMFHQDKKHLLQVLGYLNSNVAAYFIQVLNPTISCGTGVLNRLPIKKLENINYEIVERNISISRTDWDSFETSWDFICHPLAQLCHGVDAEDGHTIAYIDEAYNKWQFNCLQRFNQLKANEEELNRILIDIYGLQDVLTPEVGDKDVTVRKADLQRDIKGLISYAVGCMFGRYSLDADGLVYAGGEWDASKYRTLPADRDNIIPICDDEYFEDDIVGRFIKFVETVYGKETLAENLKFIADALGGKGNPKDVIRNYFLNDFYNDHVKMYQKRPIYWQFDSGKKNGFKCLIYMHRYREDTIARIRTDYVHEQQSRYRTAIADLEQRINGASTSDRVKLNKQLTKLKDQESELRNYEEKIHHLADQMLRIDLNDGVKNNYEIFKDVLAKIK